MNTVSLCMICKNEQTNIGILLDQVCPILEEVIVVDTGSTDGTLEILSQKKKEYPNLVVDHFVWIKDFSAARNYSFSKATQEWIAWLDCDDQVDPLELKNFKEGHLNDPSVDCWILDYIYSRYANGEPHTTLGRERFVRRSRMPRWVGAIHETIDISGLSTRSYDKLKVVHHQQGKTIDYSRNVEILASEFEKNPNDPRTAYYYGKELFDRVDPKGLEVLRHFVNLASNKWVWYDDHCNALARLAFDDIVNNKLTEALNKADKIYHLDNSRMRAEGYWIYGRVEQKLKNYKVAIKWFERCFDGQPPTPAVINREYYTWNPAYQISECYCELGDFDGAVRYYDEVVKTISPNNTMLKSLEDKILKKFFGSGPFILENCTVNVRKDSVKTNYMISNLSSFGVGKFDGIVTNVANSENCKALLKPKGFLWTTKVMESSDRGSNFGSLGEAVFAGHKFNNYIRTDSTLPNFYIHDGDWDFGPYRLRIGQLKYSLIKNGYPVHSQPSENEDISYCVSQNLNRFNKGMVKILDVCEWLPNSDYKSVGVERADMITCSSPMLAKLMKEKFPNKNILCVEDHVDFTEQEWL
jgi:glycosyltransferase involved in cell wall biosynthesis